MANGSDHATTMLLLAAHQCLTICPGQRSSRNCARITVRLEQTCLMRPYRPDAWDTALIGEHPVSVDVLTNSSIILMEVSPLP
jgi:hypothetical protein